MIKKVTAAQVCAGMYVHDLNCGWLEHGFLRNRFLITSDEQLAQIRQLGIHELHIDTERGLDLPSAPTATEVTAALEDTLVEVVTQAPIEERRVALAEERVQAKRIQTEAVGLIQGVMADARAGRALDIAHVTPLIDHLTDSIGRNQDALLGFSRVRRLGRYALEHSVNVTVHLVAFARSLGLEPEQIQAIGIGGMLHDIGNAAIPSALLNKAGRLTDAEFVVMREHVMLGCQMIARIPGIPKIALQVAAEHHERVDGSGYPRGKSGDQMTLYGKMAAIVDVYVAITSNRVYNTALEPHQALRKLLEWSSHHFDADLVRQFIRCIGIYPVGTLVRLRSGRLGVVLESAHGDPLRPLVRVFMDANRRQYREIQDVDLARLGKGSEERIESAESPARWRVDPEAILQLPC